MGRGRLGRLQSLHRREIGSRGGRQRRGSPLARVGLLAGRGDPLAVALHVGEAHQLQQLPGGPVGQPQRLMLKESAPDPGAVVGLQGVDGFQPQLGAALAVEVGGQVQGGEGVGVAGMEMDRVAVGFAALDADEQRQIDRLVRHPHHRIGRVGQRQPPGGLLG
jgi:hypothetical protein